MPFQHKTLEEGRWYELSLAEQLGNVGSEIHRALLRKGNEKEAYSQSIERALELIDLIIRDPRWRKRLKEIIRVREFVCDALYEGKDYGSTLEDLDNYFFRFAVAARIHK